VEQGLLPLEDLQNLPQWSASKVAFDTVIPFKSRLLRKAARNFFAGRANSLHGEFEKFCVQTQSWLDAYAEFSALKSANSGVAWTQWDPAIQADPQDELDEKFIQFTFFRQWNSLKKYCNKRGIEIIGDIPIFIAHDSCDVRSNPELFDLDEIGNPRNVAGVPPDYFSQTGQRWGNPLYRWDVMERTGFRWWIGRIEAMLDMVDIIRLDHFRGFEKFWEIPAESETAINGRWVEGPGNRFFEALFKALGKLPFIAEDLGYITPEVHQLRDRWSFPGMRVLQFAFGDESRENPHKPYTFVQNCVAYTGTHDNDTTAGWFSPQNSQLHYDQQNALRYMGSDGREAVWDFIRMLLSSVADTAIVPMQDYLGLGTEARMNVPSTTGNNWNWRMQEDQLRPDLASKLRELNRTYGRG
jgi:4-alpha-glucanotransferase